MQLPSALNIPTTLLKIVHISLTRVKLFEANNSANTISPYHNNFISVITIVKNYQLYCLDKTIDENNCNHAYVVYNIKKIF